MSIPPLVCSTPPPPDQCDDDKKDDHFDLGYGFAQEDDEDRNDYDFCSYNATNLTPISQNSIPNLESESIIPEKLNNIEFDKEAVTNIKVEEDNNIEDLDLQLAEALVTNKDVTSLINDDLAKQEVEKENATELSPEPSGNDTTESSPSVSSGLGLSFTESNLELDDKPKCGTNEDFIDEDCNSADNEVVTVISSEIKYDIDHNNDYSMQSYSDVFQHVVTEVKLETENILRTTVKENINDDFQDFNATRSNYNDGDDFDELDDFQLNTPYSNEVISTVNFEENPWGNDETTDNFGEFHANFDNNDTTNESKIETSRELSEINDKTIVIEDDNDDDFGDFNDFKSSTVESNKNEDNISVTDVPVLNLHTMDNDAYVENVSKILKSVYEEEISEPAEKFSKMLESLLCETWGHLLDMDNRQPYMVTWNNSLGQKTLLKSLCIDSRNILFGPKWGQSNSMPKYAANLGAAPLQPQRQTSVSSTSNSECGTEKQSKADTWTDPFTNNGQESCSSDAPAVTSPAAQGSLEGASTSKVYPTTLNIQPIRQISLPDTHIYTPTDSETPHSQTIHYDNTILVPQNKTVCDSIGKESMKDKVDSDYLDFQNFQGTAANATAATNSIPETNIGASDHSITYETQTILQPVKVENFPTLNWPDPGHVKETFDDFTDFVSNSTWFNDNTNNPKEHAIAEDSISRIESYTDSKNVAEQDVIANVTSPKTNGVDDEFDTFQSAIPSQALQLTLEKTNGKPANGPLNFTLPNVQNLGMNRNSPSKPNMNCEPEHVESPNAVVPIMKPSILQPTPALPKQPKNMGNQILQPWSLESISQINWPSPGIDLQDLSRFNPVDKVHSIKNDSASHQGSSKNSSPKHASTSQLEDDDTWGDFVSSIPKQTFPSPKKQIDDEEWSDFVSSPGIRTPNGLNTISLNVHTNLNIHKGKLKQESKLDIPTLNYINPKGPNYRGKSVNNPHFQNL